MSQYQIKANFLHLKLSTNLHKSNCVKEKKKVYQSVIINNINENSSHYSLVSQTKT